MREFYELRYITKYTGESGRREWPIDGSRDEQSVLNEIEGFIEKNHNPKFRVKLERVTREPLHTITLEEFLSSGRPLYTIAPEGDKP